MSLVLQPTLADMTTEELEQRIEQARARRIIAAMEYVAGQELKLENEQDKVRRKLLQHYTMLEKELERMERCLIALDQRVQTIEMLRQEAGLLESYK